MLCAGAVLACLLPLGRSGADDKPPDVVTVSTSAGSATAVVDVGTLIPGSSGSGPSAGVACTYTPVHTSPGADLDYPTIGAPALGGPIPYKYTCNDGSSGVIWVTPGTPGAPPIDPTVLRDQAKKTLELPVPEIRMNPASDRLQLVNLITWLWVEGSWVVTSESASAGPVVATVSAEPMDVLWDMGNGDQVVCPGPGLPYDESRPARDQQADCSYTYRRSSASQPDQRFTVTATVRWHLTWSVVGAPLPGGPDLGVMERAGSETVRVGEQQAIETS